MKQQATLRNWRTCDRDCGTLGGRHLHGNVYGHPCFHEGEAITTTGLVLFRPDLGVAETLNTVYILGDERAERQAEHHREELPA